MSVSSFQTKWIKGCRNSLHALLLTCITKHYNFSFTFLQKWRNGTFLARSYLGYNKLTSFSYYSSWIVCSFHYNLQYTQRSAASTRLRCVVDCDHNKVACVCPRTLMLHPKTAQKYWLWHTINELSSWRVCPTGTMCLICAWQCQK